MHRMHRISDPSSHIDRSIDRISDPSSSVGAAHSSLTSSEDGPFHR